MIVAVIMSRMYKTVILLSALMKVCIIHFMTRGHFSVMLVLQSCTDPLQVLPGSSCETFPSSSYGTCDIGDIKFEEEIDIKEEEKVNVKAEKGMGSEEEECIDIKDEEGMLSEEEEDLDIEEEVSCEDTV